MVKKIAAFIVAPLWHEFMSYALTKYPGEDFSPPSPDTSPETLPPVLGGNWNTNPGLGIHDILFWVDKSNPRSGPPTNASSDSQYPYWEYPIQLWAQSNPDLIGGAVPEVVPPISTPPSSLFKITSPAEGTFITWGAPIVFSVSAPSTTNIQSVTYYFNGVEIGSALAPPFSLNARPTGHGPSIVRAVAHTSSGQLEVTIPVNVQ